MFQIVFDPKARDELKNLRAFDRRRVLDETELQLGRDPLSRTRNRKPLRRTPRDDHPAWELRVGGIRVFHDVDERTRVVVVRAVRQKLHGQTTEEIL